jgi:hypothetical protein
MEILPQIKINSRCNQRTDSRTVGADERCGKLQSTAWCSDRHNAVQYR